MLLWHCLRVRLIYPSTPPPISPNFHPSYRRTEIQNVVYVLVSLCVCVRVVYWRVGACVSMSPLTVHVVLTRSVTSLEHRCGWHRIICFIHCSNTPNQQGHPPIDAHTHTKSSHLVWINIKKRINKHIKEYKIAKAASAYVTTIHLGTFFGGGWGVELF